MIDYLIFPQLGVLLIETIFPVELKNLNLPDLKDSDDHLIDTLGKADRRLGLFVEDYNLSFNLKSPLYLKYLFVFHNFPIKLVISH